MRMNAPKLIPSRTLRAIVLGAFLSSLLVICGHQSSMGHAQVSRLQPILPPAEGCYAGVFPGWGENEDSVDAQWLVEFEQLVGKGVAISPFSNFWGENYTSSQQFNELTSYGAIPLLRFMPWGPPYWNFFTYQPDYSYQRIIDGDFDTLLTDWAVEIKTFGKPVMVTFAVEMNGDWFPWSGVLQGGSTTGGFGDPSKADGPERYVAAFRHIIELFRSQGVTNVAWLFHPNHESYPEEAWNTFKAYYPGDDYIDWVGASLYGAMVPGETWVTFEEVMDSLYTELTTTFPNKPLILPEWGVTDSDTPNLKATWYTDALAKLQSHYTRIKVAIVYHERYPTNGGWTDLCVNSTPQALQAYQTGISSSYFIGSWNQTIIHLPTLLTPELLILTGAGIILLFIIIIVIRRKRIQS